MREVIIKIKCDFCEKSLQEHDTHVVPVGLKHEADLCDGCLGDLLEKMRPVSKERKAKRTAPGSSGQAYPCSVDGCSKSFAKKNGLSRHMRQTHGVAGESVH